MFKHRHNADSYPYISGMQFSAACSSLSNGLPYKITAYNYGQKGVVLMEIPVVDNDSGKPVKSPVGLSPVVPSPGGGESAIDFRYFVGHRRDLPSSVTIRWKLANLTNCQISERKGRHVLKLGCKFTHTKEDKVYTKTLDLTSIRNSDGYKQAGTRAPENGPIQRHYLNIHLIFNGDRLTVKPKRAATAGLNRVGTPFQSNW